MSTRYHLNLKTGQVSVCPAKISCRLNPGSSVEDHFDSMPEAMKSFEDLMANDTIVSHKSHKSESAPKHEIAGMSIEAIAQQLNIGPIHGYAYAGSQLYGLNTDKSDTDLALIIDGKGRDKQRMIGDMDFRVYPAVKMFERLRNCSVPEVDLMFSQTVNFTDDRYASGLEGFRFQSWKYFDNSDALAIKHMGIINENISEERRQYKSLKASTRSIFLAWKALEQGADFNPVFNERDKELYWSMMDKNVKRAENGDHWEDIRESIHLDSKKAWNQ